MAVGSASIISLSTSRKNNFRSFLILYKVTADGRTIYAPRHCEVAKSQRAALTVTKLIHSMCECECVCGLWMSVNFL